MAMTKIKLALDWTPNVNHIGFFVAQHEGFYREAGIELEWINPLTDDYTLTPGRRLAQGLTDFAIAPFETVISLNNKPNPVNAIAVYAILQQDLSSIACLKSTGIARPADLDGRHYASYQARYEDLIVKEIIKNDGGSGDIHITYPPKLGIWNTLLTGQADATWIFDNWEGIEAAHQQVALTHFRLSDFGIPYGYSPVVVTTQTQLETRAEAYKAFIQATARGFAFAKNHPEDAANILAQVVPAQDRESRPLEATVRMSAPFFGEDLNLGRMEAERVHAFLQWLVDHRLEQDVILAQKLYTNELLL